MSDKIVFRSTDPDVRAAYEAACAEHSEWSRKIHQLAKELLGPDAYPIVQEGWGRKSLSGFGPVPDDVPAGLRIWKPRNSLSHLVPHKSTKIGQEIAERVKELERAPDVRAALPGMPSCALDGLTIMSPGVDVIDDAIYVYWSNDPDAADTGWSKSAKKVDPELWQRVKLSEYYAAKEAAEESEGAA